MVSTIAKGSRWEIAAKAFRQGGNMDFASMEVSLRLAREWHEATAQGLVKEMDEVRNSELPEADKRRLLDRMLDALADKDPALAMGIIERDFAGLGPKELRQRLSDSSGTFGKLARRDPLAAAAWLDRQITAGNLDSTRLDGSSSNRQTLEAELFKTLIKDSPRMAVERVGVMEKEDRAGLLTSWRMRDLPDDAQPAFLALVRENLSAGQAAGVLRGSLDAPLAKGGLKGASEWIDRMNLSSQERSEIAGHAVDGALTKATESGKVPAAAQLAEMRAWLVGQKPEKADETMGKILALNASRNGGMDQGIDSINRLLESGPSDELIMGFLNQSATNLNTQQAENLIRRLSSPEVRQQATTVVNRNQIRWTDPD